MQVRSKIEREVKLGVWPGFVLPDFDELGGGLSVGATSSCRLEAVYFDTPDVRLLRRGVTVRFRRGEEPGDLWTAKLPAEAPTLGLARREVSVAGARGSMPVVIVDLVRGWALGAPLSPVARLRTLRHRTTLGDGDGRPLAVLDDDEVSILRGSRVAARFRELEVELADGAPASLLEQIAHRLRAAGARPVDQAPKVLRALGPPALVPWDLAVLPPRPRPTAAELVRAGLVGAAARFVDHLAAVVLDEELEGIHQARVGIRRLRSDLRTFLPMLDAAAVASLRHELGWLADELGEVRDLDVLLERLRIDAQQLASDDRAGLDEVLAGFEERRTAAYERLRAALRTPRCAELLAQTARIASAPPFTSKQAQRPAAQVVPQLVRRPLRGLRREAQQLGSQPPDAALHRVRIHVKRARYATELAAPLAGKPARRAARTLSGLQDVLGEHNDACVAITRLRDLALAATPAGAWAAGILGGLQVRRATDCRTRFAAAWKDATDRRRWDWVS